MAPYWKLYCLCCCKQLIHVLCIKMVHEEMYLLDIYFGLLLGKGFLPILPTSQWLGGHIKFSLFKCPTKSFACAFGMKDRKWLPSSTRKQPNFVPGWAAALFTSSLTSFNNCQNFFAFPCPFLFQYLFLKGKMPSYVLNLCWVEVKKEWL